MIEAYLEHKKEREAQGIPPLPLNAQQTAELCDILKNPPTGQEDLAKDLLVNRVSPGVDPAAQVKAEFLYNIAKGSATSPLISKEEAVKLLGTMVGGYNVSPLVDLLDDSTLGGIAAEALKHIILVADLFDTVANKASSNDHAKAVVQSWADAEWFTSKPAMPAEYSGIVYKVEGETNTDDFSPASEAWSRPDIPMHALSMGMTRFPDGVDQITKFQASGDSVIFVGDVVGTGSSRKSACNSVLWYIGDEIPHVPNKKWKHAD